MSILVLVTRQLGNQFVVCLSRSGKFFWQAFFLGEVLGDVLFLFLTLTFFYSFLASLLPLPSFFYPSFLHPLLAPSLPSFIFFVVLGIELGTVDILNKHSTIELHLQTPHADFLGPWIYNFFLILKDPSSIYEQTLWTQHTMKCRLLWSPLTCAFNSLQIQWSTVKEQM